MPDRKRNARSMRMKTRKIPVNLSLHPNLVKHAKNIADSKGLSLSAWVSVLISSAIDDASFPEDDREMFESGLTGVESGLMGMESGLMGMESRLTFPAVGRNEPCPCGSGKKYKKCHGS